VGEPSSASLLTDATGDADVHAFLIADIRGWTRFTQERGDEDAARLAGRFAEVTRSVVEAHRGKVLELRGDEAMIVFGSPRSAIRGAVALQQRFVEETIADPSLPLTVGIGLDAGEAVPVEGGYRGGALNVAARLCSLARAGEVLASREIVHLARRVDGVRFTERGQAQLKGLDQPVHVVAVHSEERDDAHAIAPFVRSTAPTRTPHRRRRAIVGIAAFALIAASIVVPLASRRAEGSSVIEPNSIGIMDLGSGEITGTVGLDDRPGSVAASADAVWVTNPDVGTVTRIDPTDQEVRDSVPVGENPAGIAAGFDAVWVVNSGGPSVSRISPDINEVVGDPIDVGNGPADIALGAGAVWVTNRFDGTISRIDPDGVKEFDPIPVGLDPRGIAVGFGDVWVGLAGSNTVVRVDPETNEVTHQIPVGNSPGSVAVGADSVWVVNTLDDTVSQIDPETNSVVDLVRVGDGPSAITVAEGIVWVANEAEGTLSRITPSGPSASNIVIESTPQGLAGVGSDLWVSVRGIATSHRGGTLRMVSLYGPETLDPSAAYDPNSWHVMHLLGDGLVAFKSVGGAEGATLVPDLATTLPTPTHGGRTYTFELRPGIRYSNGEVVAPTDFRHSLERGFPLQEYAHQLFYSGLLGGEACVSEPRTCDLSKGIVTDDASRTISFHLATPDHEFLYKLALNFAYPVPASTPDGQLEESVPGTGPYKLEAPMTGDEVALVRNPYFRVWSAAAQPDGYVDRIEWTWGVKPDAQVKAVATGDADLAIDAESSRQVQEILVRSSAQVHASPLAATWFVLLNTRVAPFDDIEVRQAVNFALDRSKVVDIFGGDVAALPTCQHLPPNFPGYETYCPYTMEAEPDGQGSWIAPDLEEAQRLVRRSGTEGARVVFEYPAGFWDPQGPILGNYMIELLESLGYRASVKRTSGNQFYSRDNEFQMGLDGWALDFPAASNFIVDRFTCDASIFPPTGFCDPEVDAMVDRAVRLQANDPAAAGALWAEIDRAIVDQAPYMWLMNPVDIDFVSEPVGNYQWNIQWTVLLNQLWVR
jgi:YVTN family beta-propeller protein